MLLKTVKVSRVLHANVAYQRERNVLCVEGTDELKCLNIVRVVKVLVESRAKVIV